MEMEEPLGDLLDVSEPELVKSEEWSGEDEDGRLLDHEGHHHTCLVCASPRVEEGVQPWKEYCKWGQGQRQQQPVCRLMRWNVSSVFLLRRLLHYPSDKCAELLGSSGGEEEPGGWVSLCRKCSQLVLEALQAHEEIRELEAKIGGIGSQLRAEIGRRRGFPRPPGIKLRKEVVGGYNSSSVHSTIRQFFQGPVVAEVVRKAGTRAATLLPLRNKDARKDEGTPKKTTLEKTPPESPQHFNDDEPCDDDPTWSDACNADESDDGWNVGPDPLYIPEEEEEDRNVNLSLPSNSTTTTTTRRSNRLKAVKSSSSIINTTSRGIKQRASTSTTSTTPPPAKRSRTTMNERLLECQLCQREFCNDNQFRAHMRLHSAHNSVVFSCPICAHSSSCPNTRQAHIIRRHPKATLPCPKCDGDFVTDNPYKFTSHDTEHVLRDGLEPLQTENDEPDLFRCKFCCESTSDEVVGSWLTMTRHLKVHHAAQLGLQFFQCTVCDYAAPARHTLKVHCERVHHVRILGKEEVERKKQPVNKTQACRRRADDDNSDAEEPGSEEQLPGNLSKLKTEGDDEEGDDDDGQVGPDPLYSPEMDTDVEQEDDEDNATVSPQPPPTARRSNRLKGVTGPMTFEGAALEDEEPKQSGGRQKGTRRDRDSGGSSRKCSICHAVIRNVPLKAHMRLHAAHNGTLFPCPICAHPAACPNTRRAHIIRCHPKASLSCSKSDCDFVTTNPYKYTSHGSEHQLRDGLEPLPSENGDDSFRCKFCDESSVVGSWLAMTHHLKLVHSAQLGLEFFPCSVCSHVATTRRSLKLHCLSQHHVRILDKAEVAVEQKPPPPAAKKAIRFTPVECHLCHQKFRSANRFRAHMRLHSAHNGTLFPCPVCAHPSSCPNTRQAHIIRCHPKASLPCSKCDCDFVTDNPYKFTSHDTEHTLRDALVEPFQDEPPDSFRCKFCDTSGSWVVMTRHLKTAHSAQLGLEFFPCPVCDHVAATRRTLKVHCLGIHHVRVLSKEEVVDKKPLKKIIRRNRSRRRSSPIMRRRRWAPRRVSTKASSAVDKIISKECTLCSKQFVTASQFKIHMSTHSAHNNVLFLCPICHEASPSPRTRIEHMRTSHPKASFRCSKCDCDFVTRGPYSYSSHETEHKIQDGLEPLQNESGELESSSSFRCKLCDTDTDTVGSWASLVQHMKLSHWAAIGGTRTFPCSACDHVAFARRELAQHVLQIHQEVSNNKSAGAHDAGESATSVEESNPTSRRRQLRHRYNKLWKCKLCPSSSYSTKAQLKHHTKTNHDESDSGSRRQPLLECQLCEFKAATRKLVLCHMRANHGELYPHACDSCSATFPTLQRLQIHQECRHAEEKEGPVVSCPYCGVRAKNAVSLKSHIRNFCKQKKPAEEKEKRKWERRKTEVAQECDQCDFKTTWKDAFATHLQGHVIAEHFEEVEVGGSEEPLARCKLCGKVCSSVTTRYTHLNTKHAAVFGAQSYQCQYCGMGFNTYRRFRLHANRHKRQEKEKEASTGAGRRAEKEKVMCEFCGAPFASRGAVKLHCQTFHPEQTADSTSSKTIVAPAANPRPPPPVGMKCKYCPVSTVNHHLMATHLRAEHPEKFRHQCDLCPAKYQLKQELTRHKASKHYNKKWKCEYCGGEYSFTKKRCSHVKRDCKAAPHRRRTAAGKKETSGRDEEEGGGIITPAPEQEGPPPATPSLSVSN